MITNSFTYNGINSREFGLYISSKNVFSAPGADVSMQSVPGRNGDLLLYNKRYDNVSVSYSCWFKAPKGHTIAEISGRIKAWLLRAPNYCRLSDTYDRQYYREGAYSGPLDIEDTLNKFAEMELTFNCKPFRRAYTGDQVITLDRQPAVVVNPEGFASQPYIKIYGGGNILLDISNETGGGAWAINNVAEYVEIDSNLMDCYKDITLKNQDFIGGNTYGFPLLAPGKNEFIWDGEVTKIEIIPRWCTL